MKILLISLTENITGSSVKYSGELSGPSGYSVKALRRINDIMKSKKKKKHYF